MTRKELAALVAILAWLALGAQVALATPTVNAVVGLGDRFVPGRFTPVTVTVAGLSPDAASLRFVHAVGNAWRGQASMTYEVPLALSDAGTQEEVLPLYDASLPLRVELLGSGGEILARTQIELRPRKEDAAFPVAVGSFPLPVAERLIVLAPEELPHQWSAYDSAESLWIGRTRGGVDADRWDALARWVLSGGTLVVFSGSDFYLLDAPVLRDLLPLETPVLIERADGIRALEGRVREDARVLLVQDDVPWLISRRLGAGTVLLVTTDAFSVDAMGLAELRAKVPPARILSLLETTSALLNEQPVDGPAPWAALLLVGVGLIALSAIVVGREWRPWMGTALLGVFGLVAVSSGFYANRARTVSDVYVTTTELHIEAQLGITLSCVSCFSASRDPLQLEVSAGQPPLEALPRSLEEASYDLSYRLRKAGVSLSPGERRLFVGRDVALSSLHARLTGDEEARITSRLPRELAEGLLIVDGEAFLLPPLQPGETTAYLGTATALGDAHLGERGAPLERLFVEAARALPLDRGAWLVAGEVVDATPQGDGPRTKVRDVRLYVVEVKRD
jgi:hypothetical protein